MLHSHHLRTRRWWQSTIEPQQNASHFVTCPWLGRLLLGSHKWDSIATIESSDLVVASRCWPTVVQIFYLRNKSSLDFETWDNPRVGLVTCFWIRVLHVFLMVRYFPCRFHWRQVNQRDCMWFARRWWRYGNPQICPLDPLCLLDLCHSMPLHYFSTVFGALVCLIFFIPSQYLCCK